MTVGFDFGNGNGNRDPHGMTPEQLVEQLRAALGPALKAVVLYGSAAAGDFVEGRSDYNVLVVAEPLGLAEFARLSKPSRAWARAGNRPPLLFRPGQLAASVDAFPIELLDLGRFHRVLLGDDPLAGVDVPIGPLRLQLEREFKGKLLNLRERAVLTGGKPRKLLALMTATVHPVLVLTRAAVRLYQADVPASKLDALDALAGHVQLDAEPIRIAAEVRSGHRRGKDVDVPSLFSAYLRTIEHLGEAIDRHPGGQASA